MPSEPVRELGVSEDATAQDVIDALRLVLMSQKAPEEAATLVEMLLEFAPGTDSNRGIELVMSLIAEGSLRVEAAVAREGGAGV